MNILLVYPEFPETFWSYSHALRFVGKKAVSPPLGLLTVASLLPKEWHKRLIDTNVTRLRDTDLQWADYVFVSAMGVQRSSTQALVRRCKAAGKKIVAGGPLFTAEEAFFEEVDHFVLNEAELTLPPFLADLESGTPQRIYRTQQYADLTTSPIPSWELLDQKRLLVHEYPVLARVPLCVRLLQRHSDARPHTARQIGEADYRRTRCSAGNGLARRRVLRG